MSLAQYPVVAVALSAGAYLAFLAVVREHWPGPPTSLNLMLRFAGHARP